MADLLHIYYLHDYLLLICAYQTSESHKFGSLQAAIIVYVRAMKNFGRDKPNKEYGNTYVDMYIHTACDTYTNKYIYIYSILMYLFPSVEDPQSQCLKFMHCMHCVHCTQYKHCIHCAHCIRCIDFDCSLWLILGRTCLQKNGPNVKRMND